jgi:hypothetical protein
LATRFGIAVSTFNTTVKTKNRKDTRKCYAPYARSSDTRNNLQQPPTSRTGEFLDRVIQIGHSQE